MRLSGLEASGRAFIPAADAAAALEADPVFGRFAIGCCVDPLESELGGGASAAATAAAAGAAALSAAAAAARLRLEDMVQLQFVGAAREVWENVKDPAAESSAQPGAVGLSQADEENKQSAMRRRDGVLNLNQGIRRPHNGTRAASRPRVCVASPLLPRPCPSSLEV
jgi:hypothetical protein